MVSHFDDNSNSNLPDDESHRDDVSNAFTPVAPCDIRKNSGVLTHFPTINLTNYPLIQAHVFFSASSCSKTAERLVPPVVDFNSTERS